ncbi:MAG: hypothetical protein JW909_03620 [Planctomycetes bacterium]|nr:hypothetical protein [Planctomycetota bacterium]
MFKALKAEFKNPPCEYRGAPFWSWNDRLDPAEIRRQIRMMKRAGMGGFFMHSRGGLETPFHGEEWFRVVDAAVEEARSLGMYAWAYDEDRWPSGPAGGLTHMADPSCALWRLAVEEAAEYPALAAGVIAVFRRRNSSTFVPASPGDTGDIVVFRQSSIAGGGWTNNRPPFNVLSAQAVDSFIRAAYKPYADRYPAEIKAGVLPGVFTDEPNYRPGGADSLSWTPELPQEFRRRRGYDIVPCLPALLENVKSPRKDRSVDEIRHDYHQTLSELFEENFSGRIGDFCGRHGLALTGHYLCEQPLKIQARVGGSAMPHYIHQQVPGIDILCRRTDEIITVKQTASVARQWGRRKLISELYGASGWELSLTDQKKIGDWQYALGVNFRCQHLALYSMRGERKRDFPPSLYIQQPWWPHHRLVADYFARLSLAMRVGSPLREVAVIHPMESVWAALDNGAAAKVDPIDSALYDLADNLLYNQVDFDFIDESLLERFGSAGRSGLRMNKVSYRVVVVPKLTHLRPSTAEKLLAFASAGGRLFSLVRGGVKIYAGGVSRSSLNKLASRLNSLLSRSFVGSKTGLVSSLKQSCSEPVAVKGKGRLLYQLRADGRERLLFLTNQSDGPVSVSVELSGGGSPSYWDLESGRNIPLAADKLPGNRISIPLHLPFAGSALISYEKTSSLKAPAPVRLRSAAKARKIAVPARLPFSLSMPNVLYVDKATIEVEGTGLSLQGFVPQIARSVKQVYNLPAGRYSEAQPWTWRRVSTGKTVSVTYDFRVDAVPPGKVQLALERLSRKSIKVNGRTVKPRKKGFYLDKTIEIIDLPKLRKGLNSITLSEPLDESFEAEAVYVLGSFGVKDNRIVPMPKTVLAADWTSSGLPFYAGAVTLHVPVSVSSAGRYSVEIDAQGAVVVGAGPARGKKSYRAFPPFSFALDLPQGRSVVDVELLPSLRNLMGPHHFSDPRPGWSGPSEMAPESPVDRYVFIPSGILGMKIAEAAE